MNGRVIIGIAAFVLFFSSPFWMNFVGAKGLAEAPKPELPKVEKKCVESASYMRANHMQILENWRLEVVRDDQRTYVSHESTDEQGNPLKFDKSLTRTCLKCHNNKKNFCDRCHTYANVKPYCWKCHVIPEERL